MDKVYMLLLVLQVYHMVDMEEVMDKVRDIICNLVNLEEVMEEVYQVLFVQQVYHMVDMQEEDLEELYEVVLVQQREEVLMVVEEEKVDMVEEEKVDMVEEKKVHILVGRAEADSTFIFFVCVFYMHFFCVFFNGLKIHIIFSIQVFLYFVLLFLIYDKTNKQTVFCLNSTNFCNLHIIYVLCTGLSLYAFIL